MPITKSTPRDESDDELWSRVQKHNAYMKVFNKTPTRHQDFYHPDLMRSVPKGYKEMPSGAYRSTELDRPSRHESINLIEAISENDTIGASEQFNSILMSKITSLIEERRQDVAENMFDVNENLDYSKEAEHAKELSKIADESGHKSQESKDLHWHAFKAQSNAAHLAPNKAIRKQHIDKSDVHWNKAQDDFNESVELDEAIVPSGLGLKKVEYNSHEHNVYQHPNGTQIRISKKAHAAYQQGQGPARKVMGHTVDYKLSGDDEWNRYSSHSDKYETHKAVHSILSNSAKNEVVAQNNELVEILDEAIIVEPKLNSDDRKALSAYIQTLKKSRPAYVKPGMSFEYRGSKVTFNESVEINEIKSNKNSYGVVDTNSGKYTHTGLTKDVARQKAQGMNVAHYGHQKATGRATDIPKAYAAILHLPTRKVGEKYAGDMEHLKWSM